VIALLARFASALMLRRLEVTDAGRLPRDRPVLLVANHFNGFLDPVVVTAALRRLPRFIAKDTLTKVPLAGLLLRRVGVVFVRRRADSPDAPGTANADAFAECHAALAKRDLVAIFPEGTTHDRPQLDPIKTGAARIALGARAAGATDLVVLPVGITFPDKLDLRPSALVQLGEPIALDGLVDPGVGPDDHDAVGAVTTAIDVGLRAVSPDFPDTETALSLTQAAHIALSSELQPTPPLAAEHRLANRLARAEPDAIDAVRRDVGRYSTLLAGLRLTDDDVIRPTSPSRLLRSAIGIAVLVVLLGSVVAATALVNIWPALAVAAVSLFVRTPVTKGTVRFLVGFVAFPVAWVVGANAGADGFLPVTGLFLLMALGALAAIWLVERALALGLMLLRWRAQVERAGTVGLAEELRGVVVATVRSAVPEQ
jgi:glycerol-3-phosphate O-acyltransferase/dihydroxyacetone phosphate acyltransferase